MRVTALLLLAVAQVQPEWVEISQQTYRKPMTVDTRRSETKETVNKSVANDYFKYNDNPWSKGNVLRVHNVGTVKRVQPVKASKPVKVKITREDKITENITTERLPAKDVSESYNKIKDDKKPSEIEVKLKVSEDNKKAPVEQSTTTSRESAPVREEDSVSRDNKFDDVLRFLKIVSETISKNTHKNLGSKLRYLHDLRDSLLHSIEAKIDETWPDEDRGGRQARSAPLLEHRGHVEFPSSEGALMSISFLTFAVFLIKLVLQVIQTYKNKTMMMTPTVVAVSKMDSKLST